MKYIIAKSLFTTFVAGSLMLGGCSFTSKNEQEKPNILILMSDNQSWNHLGCYGDPVVKSPNIDSLAKTGTKFINAFCAAPSCTPARAAFLTGQEIWRLEEGANLTGTLPSHFKVYTDMLEDAGYLVGHQGKGWGPGNYKAGGWDRNPAGDKFKSIQEFMSNRKEGQPFCYWFSSRNPHRPYDQGYQTAEIDVASIKVPGYLPDNDTIRGDMADYYGEIQQFDQQVGSFLEYLKEIGEMENTMIVVCSDNGWQMPRGLANLYDFGTKVPMIIKMPGKTKGRVVEDFVSLNDLAPTFLELAHVAVPEEMTGRSLMNILQSNQSGTIESDRNFIVTARERHAFVRQDGKGYGGRAIRTDDYLYIRNYNPERWPAGDPPLFGDVDAHMLHYPSPTKVYILKHREKENVEKYFDLGFAKRPAEELYDLTKDPFQLNNVAQNEDYQEIKKDLAEKLNTYLKNTNDPRVVGGEMKWIGAKYFSQRDKRPKPSASAREALGLKKEYSYID